MIDRKTMMEDDTTATSTTTCGHCGVADRKILHHIRLTGTFRRLCTTCVLRLHPKSFCPACLIVYHLSPPDHAFFCYKCHSSSHRTCVSPSVTGRTLCATCLNPNTLVFDFKASDWSNSYNNSNRRIDLSAARLLVAAAEISSMSTSKAEAAAVMEAEWRAKEASDWRKKAKEAVNHVVKLMEIEKKKRGDDLKAVVDVVDGNCNKKFVAMPVMDVGIDNGNGSIEVSKALNAVKLEGESVYRTMEI